MSQYIFVKRIATNTVCFVPNLFFLIAKIKSAVIQTLLDFSRVNFWSICELLSRTDVGQRMYQLCDFKIMIALLTFNSCSVFWLQRTAPTDFKHAIF